MMSSTTITRHRSQPQASQLPRLQLVTVGTRILGRVSCSCCDGRPQHWQAMARDRRGKPVPCDMTMDAFKRFLALDGWIIEQGGTEPVCPVCLAEYRQYMEDYRKSTERALVQLAG